MRVQPRRHLKADAHAEALGKDHQPGVKGAESTELLQVEGQEEEHPDQARGAEEERQAGSPEHPVLVQAQVQHRLWNSELNDDHRQQTHSTADAREHHFWRSPALGRRLRECVQGSKPAPRAERAKPQGSKRPGEVP